MFGAGRRRSLSPRLTAAARPGTFPV